jgi:hypothetical protein
MTALGFWERSITKKIFGGWRRELDRSRVRLKHAILFQNCLLAHTVLRAWQAVPASKKRMCVCHSFLYFSILANVL